MNVLFISHNGLSEPLGRSQVLAYLEALVPLGHQFELVTFEPEKSWPTMETHAIRHHPIPRQPGSSLSAKLRDLAQGLRLGKEILETRNIDVIHARSLLPAALAEALRSGTRHPVRLVFDLPGFLPQEFLDAGYWTKDDLRYQLARAAEDILIARSDGIAVGTSRAETMLQERIGAARFLPPVEIVPSCVDTDRFRPDPEARAVTRRRLGVGQEPLVLYSGTLGSWYLHTEMVRFFAQVRHRHRKARFVVATRSDPAGLLEEARRQAVLESVSLLRMAPEDMPALIAGADLGLCLVASAPSKRASSPVKMAEYLACGLPTLVNAGVGDMEQHARQCPALVLLENFSDNSLAAAADRLDELRAEDVRQAARTYALENFDLRKVGAERYHRLYQRALGSR